MTTSMIAMRVDTFLRNENRSAAGWLSSCGRCIVSVCLLTVLVLAASTLAHGNGLPIRQIPVPHALSNTFSPGTLISGHGLVLGIESAGASAGV